YVDGGVWSATNLDVAAVRRGDRILCLTPMTVLTMSRWPAVRAVGRACQLAATLEAASVRRRGGGGTGIFPHAAPPAPRRGAPPRPGGAAPPPPPRRPPRPGDRQNPDGYPASRGRARGRLQA